MSLKLITATGSMPVALEDAKEHLRVDGTDEDNMIYAMIVAATQAAEHATNLALSTQTWELTHDFFPCHFKLTRTPVVSVTSLKYIDLDGTEQTLGSSHYLLDTASDYGPARVLPAYMEIWPGSRSQANAVTLRFVCGYDTPEAVPQGIKQWIKLQIGAMFENRQSEGARQTYPLGFADRLLDRYKIW